MQGIIKLHVIITSICFLTTLPTLAPANQLINFVNRTYQPESLALTYTESFRLIDNTSNGDPQGIAIYADPSGNKLAIKRFTFFQHRYQPDFEFEDHRDGYSTGVIRSGEHFRIFFKPSRSKPLKEKVLKIPEPVVVDVGIHFFVLSVWDRLLAGEDVKLSYIVPKNLDYFRMEISKIPNDNSNIKTQAVFKVRPRNLFLNLVSNVVDSGITLLTYDIATKKILQYRGVSLIRNASGKNYSVQSVYEFE